MQRKESGATIKVSLACNRVLNLSGVLREAIVRACKSASVPAAMFCQLQRSKNGILTGVIA